MLAAWQARIPDIAVSQGTVVRIWAEVFANSATGLTLALQLLHDDIFVQTMSTLALQRAGEEFGRRQKPGIPATGTVTLAGAGGTYVASGSQVGAPQAALGTTLVFETTEDVTIPAPGAPTAPTATEVDSGLGDIDGTIEYGVTFATAGGETTIGAASSPVSVVDSNIDLADVALGGAGTVARKLYRRRDGGAWKYVVTLADNTTTTYHDTAADAALGASPPAESTAERVDAAAEATEVGVDHNVGVGAISLLVDVDGDVTGVTNSVPFTGGEDSEAIEEFRQALLAWVRSPQSGSAEDLVNWAVSIDGVDSASVFKNVNLAGSAELGSVVVRIAGVGGAVPSGAKVAEVLAYLESKDHANITIYVGTFASLTVDVTVDVVLASGYALADVAPSVEAAVAAYVDSVPVAGTVYLAGLVHTVFALPGVVTVEVDLPADDVISTDGEKPVAGVITVNEWTWWS